MTDIDGYQAVVLGSAAFMWCRRVPSTIDVTHLRPSLRVVVATPVKSAELAARSKSLRSVVRLAT